MPETPSPDDQFDKVFVADPAAADLFDDEPVGPKWPKVVGILAIVVGSFFFLCGGVGAVFLFVQPQMMQSFASNFEGGVPPVMTTTNPAQVTSAIIGVVWSALLILSGILCVMRNPTARKLFLLYGTVGIVLGLWGLSMQMNQQAAVQDWIAAHPDSDFAQQASGPGSQIGRIFGLVIGVGLGLGWPAFCVFFFGFVKTKPEQFTGGAEIDTI